MTTKSLAKMKEAVDHMRGELAAMRESRNELAEAEATMNLSLARLEAYISVEEAAGEVKS